MSCGQSYTEVSCCFICSQKKRHSLDGSLLLWLVCAPGNIYYTGSSSQVFHSFWSTKGRSGTSQPLSLDHNYWMSILWTSIMSTQSHRKTYCIVSLLCFFACTFAMGLCQGHVTFKLLGMKRTFQMFFQSFCILKGMNQLNQSTKSFLY